MKTHRLLLLAVLLVPWSLRAQTEVPGLISYQGIITDVGGNLVGDPDPENRTVTLRIWDAQTAGNLIYSEEQVATISKGEFSVLVGAGVDVSGEEGTGPGTVNIADAFDGNQRYLGVTVDDGTTAADLEISPRQQIVTSPFSFRAREAETVIASGIVTSAIGNGAVTLDKMAVGSVNGNTLVDGSVGTPDLGTGVVTLDKMATDSVDSDSIVDGSVGTPDLGDGAITLDKMAAGSVNGDSIVDGSIGTPDLGTGAVTLGKMAAGSVDLTKLVAAVREALCPPGSIMPFAGTTAPSGWLPCDGRALDKDADGGKYQQLYNNILTGWGNGSSGAGSNGNTDFNLPDLRGMFLRGSGTHGSKQDAADSPFDGSLVGTYQQDTFQGHWHNFKFLKAESEANSGGVTFGGAGYRDMLENILDSPPLHSVEKMDPYGTPRVASETKPASYSINYIIKY